MVWMPLSLILPATMPDIARRRLAASSLGGISCASVKAAMDSWVGSKGLLEQTFNGQFPVEVVGILADPAEAGDFIQTAFHGFGDSRRIINNDLIERLCFFAQGRANEFINALEVFFSAFRAGKDQGEGDLPVLVMQHHAKNIKNLLGGARAARGKRQCHARVGQTLPVVFQCLA